MENNSRKCLILNLALLLGVSAILFRGYLPVAEEITGLNQQLHSLENRIKSLKSPPGNRKRNAGEHPPSRRITALPESETEHLSQELAALAVRHDMKLIQVDPDSEQAEKISRLKIKLTPYVMGFSGKDASRFASLLNALEHDFPELLIRDFSYTKEMGLIDAQLVTSSQEVRLFAP